MALADKIARIPESVRRSVRDGLALLGRLPAAARELIFQSVSETIGSGASNIDLEPIVDETKLTAEEASSIVSALSITIGLASDDGISLEELLSAGKGTLYDENSAAAASDLFSRIVADAKGWKARLDRRTMSVETLPAFFSLNYSVDLRMRFEKEQIVDAVPVVLVHLDTDTQSQEIWFQATRGDIQLIVDRLTRIARELDLAEELYRSRRKD